MSVRVVFSSTSKVGLPYNSLKGRVAVIFLYPFNECTEISTLSSSTFNATSIHPLIFNPCASVFIVPVLCIIEILVESICAKQK